MMDHGVWIDGAGRRGGSGDVLQVANPFNHEVIARLATASTADVDQAVHSARSTFIGTMRTMPAYQRAQMLRACADQVRAGSDELVDLVVSEAGKPIRDARREIGRAAAFLELAADYVMVQAGQVVPMDVSPSGVNRMGFATRVPVGVVVAIAPSNSPVNLAMNKIAPALAMGNTVVLKPSDRTPLSALWLAGAFKRAGVPDGALNVLVGSVDKVANPLVRDARVRMVTITGSCPAGLAVMQAAGIKKVALELGSNSANVVRADADVIGAARSLATSAFLSSGQACISAQRLFIHESVKDQFMRELVTRAQSMVIGDPREPETELGAMISDEHISKVRSWVEEAVRMGAVLHTGGDVVGATMRPTVLEDVPSGAVIASTEVFAPVAIVESFTDDDDVIARVNDSDFGLQAGVFTNDIKAAFRFAKDIDAGAVWVNESSRYRQDNYPFGGMKLSGVGREGVQYAMEEMSEWKFVGLKLGESVGIL